jgi:hypothetical protein
MVEEGIHYGGSANSAGGMPVVAEFGVGYQEQQQPPTYNFTTDEW